MDPHSPIAINGWVMIFFCPKKNDKLGYFTPKTGVTTLLTTCRGPPCRTCQFYSFMSRFRGHQDHEKGSELDIESPVFSRVFKLKPKPVESVRNINYINDTDDHGNSTCSSIHRLHRCTFLASNSSHQKTVGFVR